MNRTFVASQSTCADLIDVADVKAESMNVPPATKSRTVTAAESQFVSRKRILHCMMCELVVIRFCATELLQQT